MPETEYQPIVEDGDIRATTDAFREVVCDGGDHTCDACGMGFRTLAELRLHDKDGCEERAVFADLDPDSDTVGVEAAAELLTCRRCGVENANANYDQTTSFADGDYHHIVEFPCRACGFANENRVVMEGVDEADLKRLPPRLQPDEGVPDA